MRIAVAASLVEFTPISSFRTPPHAPAISGTIDNIGRVARLGHHPGAVYPFAFIRLPIVPFSAALHWCRFFALGVGLGFD